jgi:hypothetical protein
MRLTTAQTTFIAIFIVAVFLYPGKQKKWMFAIALALSLLHTYDHLFRVSRNEDETFLLA